MPDPWFKFYASDYLLDPEVDALALEGQGILVRLFCLVWRDLIIADDPLVLARRAGVDPKAMQRHWGAIRDFFQATDGGLISPRMEWERAASSATTAARRRGAAVTNGKRWGKRCPSDSPSDNPATDERFAQSSLTDRSATNERIAQVSVSESESESDKRVPPKPPKGGARRRLNAPDESLEEILGGGAGTATWEAYWALHGVFGGDIKNPTPAVTSRIYAGILASGVAPEHIQAKAAALRSKTSEERFMPKLQKWLEGKGYLSRDAASGKGKPKVQDSILAGLSPEEIREMREFQAGKGRP